MIVTLAASAYATSAGCTSAWGARRPGAPLKPGFNLFSKQDDVQIGQENAKQVLAQYEVVKNPAVQDYVQKIGQKLMAALKKSIEKARSVAKENDLQAIKSAVSELEQASQAFSKVLYERTQAAGPAPEAGAAGGSKPDDDAIDAEFEVKK